MYKTVTMKIATVITLKVLLQA